MTETKGKYTHNLIIETGWVNGDLETEIDVTDHFSKEE